MTRSIPYITALVSLILLIIPIGVAAKLSREFTAMATSFNKGKIDELAAQMLSARAGNDEERSLLLYLNAMLKKSKTEQVAGLEQNITKYPSALYSQWSLLELGRIHILERETAKAKTALQRITSTDIMERFYWLAVCAEMTDDTNGVIANAENYLRLAPNGVYWEEAHYLMVDAYMTQSKYQSAISTLNKVKARSGYPTDQQYFYYLMGLCYQKSGNHAESLSNYHIGLELDRYSQLAYQIEDNMFELKRVHGSKVDLSFLFPYVDLNIPTEIVADTPVVVIPEIETPTPDMPLKLGAKPKTGIYLQLGKFSVEANAGSLANKIRQLKLPAVYFEDNKSYVSICGPFKTSAEAEQAKQALKSNNYDSFVVTYK